jgi:tetratricopeptide (TPR) repeat protein
VEEGFNRGFKVLGLFELVDRGDGFGDVGDRYYFVQQRLDQYPEEKRDPEFLIQIMNVLDQLALRYLEAQRYQESRQTYEKVLQVFEEANFITEQQKAPLQASTYHQLGAVAQELREFDEARANYQQAIQIYVEFNDRYSQARTYHNLGMVAEELREFDEARANYQQALQIKVEFNDRYSQASTYHQLGRVAEELREFDEAGTTYLKALVIYVEFNDGHNLGIVLRSCACIYQAHPSPQFLTQVAQSLGSSETEVLQLFEPMG